MAARLTDQQVLDRLAAGVPLEALASELEVTPRRASGMVAKAAERVAALDPSEDVQARVELAHLELIRRSLTPPMLRGDVAAARVLERVARTRLEVLGVLGAAGAGDDSGRPRPAPTTSGDDDEVADELAALRTQRAAR